MVLLLQKKKTFCLLGVSLILTTCNVVATFLSKTHPTRLPTPKPNPTNKSLKSDLEENDESLM